MERANTSPSIKLGMSSGVLGQSGTTEIHLCWARLSICLSMNRPEFRVRAPKESGGGPPHSKTLARRPQSLELPPGFGVRRLCGALDFPGGFMVPMHAEKNRKGAFHEPFPKSE
jgi:hypothetical protein